MRIALYNLTTTTRIGGVESFVWDLARELAKRGHAVDILGGVGQRREAAPESVSTPFPTFHGGFGKRCRRYDVPTLKPSFSSG